MATDHINPLVRTELLSHLANSLTRSSSSQQVPVLESKLSTAVPRTPQPSLSTSSQTQWSRTHSSFPSTLHTQLMTAGSFPATLPSPPSSPLGQEKASHIPAQQILLSGGIPAFIVPSDAFHLLPLTLQHPSTKSLDPWRPW